MRGPYGKLWTEFFSFLLWPKREARGPWKQGRKKRGSITCPTDWANEANKMFIIWLCWLFRFWKGDRELEVRTATYGPGIDQSQHAKSVSHIICVRMQVCMYICVSTYVCMYVCMYACMYVCMYLHMYVCMFVWRYLRHSSMTTEKVLAYFIPITSSTTFYTFV